MSRKHNQEDPSRRQRILARREKYKDAPDKFPMRTNPINATLLAFARYVPGNGDQHRLGRK